MTGSGEDDLIARLFAPIAGPAGLGLRDDAALQPMPAGHDLVLTADALVAGVHFFPADAAPSVARKALAVNVSDLAAKAATPLGFLLSLALPASIPPDWLEAFAAQLGVEAARHGCPLVGGDTVATPGPLMVSVTALGTVAAGRMLRRTGARAGQHIYVSGTVGDGALGLAVRRADLEPASAPAWLDALDPASRIHLRDRYLHPEPRLALRTALGHASAGMDVSDGLVGDLAKMLRVSGVSGRLDAARVPLSAAAAAALGLEPALRETILTGGDDYEILATVDPGEVAAFEEAAAAAGVAVTAIGEVLAGDAPLRVEDAAQPLVFARPAFSHV